MFPQYFPNDSQLEICLMSEFFVKLGSTLLCRLYPVQERVTEEVEAEESERASKQGEDESKSDAQNDQVEMEEEVEREPVDLQSLAPKRGLAFLL